ncbi:TPA_asm: hypothetical protein vir555_00039 [Caudoviricetes sp. vir555]|nr:TPA_asm: hypothetical protein vir555_00039 [Caudoviricetes sp. vir555]
MDKRRFRQIYQAMAAPERLALERLLFMGKRDRFGLIATMAGLTDEDKEFLFSLENMTSEEANQLIAYAARGFIIHFLKSLFGL